MMIMEQPKPTKQPPAASSSSGVALLVWSTAGRTAADESRTFLLARFSCYRRFMIPNSHELKRPYDKQATTQNYFFILSV